MRSQNPARNFIFVAPIAAVVAHSMRMLANLVIVKMIAVFIGPAGLGVLGNFMSLTTIISVFAGGGIGNGITKYVAEYRFKKRLLIKFLGASIVYGLGVSTLVFIICLVAAKQISIVLFGSDIYSWLIYCVGVAHFICFVGVFVIAVVNGLEQPICFAGITVAGYLGALPLVYYLISNYNIEGAAIALLLVISCSGIPAFFIFFKTRLIRSIRLNIDLGNFFRLARFSIMLISSASLFPLAEILIRSKIIEYMGNDEAGLWQGMTRLSVAYVGFFTVFLTATYMPKLSSNCDDGSNIKLAKKYIRGVFVVFSLFALLLYLCRYFVIQVLFSPEFYGMAGLFGFQLLGDLFKVCSYVVGFIAVARAATKIYILAEFFQVGLYVAISLTTIIRGGSLIDVAQAYALTYFAYLFVVGICFNVYRKKVIRHSLCIRQI